MNEELSIGTDIAREPDVALTAQTDTDGNVPVDIKHLLVDPENVAQFREQLHCKSQSKATESASTTEGATKRNASENPVSKYSATNGRTLFGNNTGHTSPFVAGKSPHPPQNQSTDGSRKDFHEKSMQFDISSQSSALKTADGVVTDNVTHEEHVAHKSPFFEALDPSRISVNNTKDFRETFTNTETLSTDTSLRNTALENKTSSRTGVSQSHPIPPQPSQRLKSPATLLRELQTPTETARQNVPETSKPLSKTDNTASTSEPLSKIKTREHPHSPESTSDAPETAVWETISFLRTSNETVATVQEPTVAQASKSHAMLLAQQIRDHIIDRILVSSSTLNGNRTVTVQLSPRLLQDTEVQFTQNGTSLDIRLVSQNKDSVQFLQQHQSDLRTYLQGELKTYRAISVRVPSSQASSELSQPHDGRSRNRFDYQSADEEETT